MTFPLDFRTLLHVSEASVWIFFVVLAVVMMCYSILYHNRYQ